jgi:thioredoxin 1
MIMAYINITKANFEAEVLNSSNTVLLDFWAPWCGPCRMVAPIVEEIAAENEDVTLGKINIDEEMELAVKFGIVSIPTLIVVEKGQVTAKAVGYRPKADILKLLGK